MSASRLHPRASSPITAALLVVLALLGTFVLVLVLVPVSPAAAGGGTTIIDVTTTDDELDPNPTVPGPDVSLREAIGHSNAQPLVNDLVVRLAPGAAYELDLCGPTTDPDNATGGLAITTPMSFHLQGNGSTVRQTCAGEVVLLKSAGPGQLVVDGVRITGGTRGGVVSIPNLRIQESTIEQNLAANAGGGAFSSLDVHVERSTIRNNLAGTSGGAVHAERTLTVIESTLSGNRATSTGGAAGVGGVLIERSTIADNTATGGGGGVTSFGSLEVRSSTVARNQARTRGGGVLSLSSAQPTTITSSTLVANRAPVGANLHTAAGSTALVARSIVGLGSGGADCALGGDGNLPNLVGADESCYGILQPADQLSLHPMVAPTAENGGPTATQRPVSPSRAIDAYGSTGNPPTCPDGPDQRSADRPQGASCDAGAFEGASAPCTPTFGDVPATAPFFTEVCWLTQMGITSGHADGGYHPAAPVSRQAMAAFLYRLALSPPFDRGEHPQTFSDVPDAAPFAREIGWLHANEIAGGFSDGTFRPLAPVSRQAMAAFLHRVAGGPAPAVPPAQTFSDVAPTHPFFDEIAWMATASVSTGFDDGTYRPSTAVSRQAMAAFLRRLAVQVPLLGL